MAVIWQSHPCYQYQNKAEKTDTPGKYQNSSNEFKSVLEIHLGQLLIVHQRLFKKLIISKSSATKSQRHKRALILSRYQKEKKQAVDTAYAVH
jgi:hypothetical protein